MMNKKRPFNKLARPFRENIYRTLKGRVRLAVLWQDMQENIPSIKTGRLSILDAGGGMGQISRKAAALGHTIILCDESEEMLNLADAENRKEGLSDRISTVHCRLEELSFNTREKFDLILFHGVIAWLPAPVEAMTQLAGFLKPGGYFSLLFYNLNRLILKCGAGAQLAQIETGRYIPKKKAKPLTPPNPLTDTRVKEWLTSQGLKIISKAGIRIFYDLMRNPDEFSGKEKKLIEVESFYKNREPFASLGQHTHLISVL